MKRNMKTIISLCLMLCAVLIVLGAIMGFTSAPESALGLGLIPFAVGAIKIRDEMCCIRPIKATLTVATTKDTIYLVNGMPALAANTALANAENVFYVGGMIEYAKANVAITGGQRAYWDGTAGKFTPTFASPCVLAGIFAYDAAQADTTAFVVLSPRLNGYGLQPKKAATIALADAAATLTAAQLIYAGLFTITPSAGRALTVDTAALIVAGAPGCEVGDYFDFSIACLAAFAATVTTAAGITLVGSMAVNNQSARFRAEFTNVGSGTEAVTITRIS